MEDVTRLLHEGKPQDALIALSAYPETVELQAVLNSALKGKKGKRGHKLTLQDAKDMIELHLSDRASSALVVSLQPNLDRAVEK